MAVPAGRYERIYEAAVRGRGKLLPSVASQLAELFEPETLFALCVLVGLWAAAQLTRDDLLSLFEWLLTHRNVVGVLVPFVPVVAVIALPFVLARRRTVRRRAASVAD